MQDLKKEIGDKIVEKRPKLGASSIKTYISILSNIYKAMDGDGGIDFYSENVKKILEYLETKPDPTKKTSLSSLFVITGETRYREAMMDIIKKVNDSYKEQKKTPKQEENWISTDEVNAVYQTNSRPLYRCSQKSRYSTRVNSSSSCSWRS